MNANAGLAHDVVFFLVETTIQSALLVALVVLVIRALNIRNPALQRNLWLIALVGPVVGPFICHLVLPRSTAEHELKLLERVLAEPIIWLDSHLLLASLAGGALLATVFALDALRWLACAFRARGTSYSAPGQVEQEKRCAAALKSVCECLGVSPGFPIAVRCGTARAVCAMRWPRPVVQLPADIAAQLDGRELRVTLAHEVAHLRHRDWLRLLVAQLCRDLMFINPLSHLALRRATAAMELVADDAAAATRADRVDLAASLVKAQRLALAPPAAALALVGQPAGSLARAQRLLDTMPAAPPTRGQRGAVWAMLGMVLLLSILI